MQFLVQAHDVRLLALESLKVLGDCIIADQHFTCRDFVNAVSWQYITFLLC
jgi:hypothetical protein